MALLQVQDAEAGTKRLGRILGVLQHLSDHGRHVAVQRPPPEQQPLGAPLGIHPVLWGHVVGQRGVATWAAITLVLDQAHVVVVDRDRALVVEQLDLGARIAGAQMPGHAVVVPVFAQLHVIV